LCRTTVPYLCRWSWLQRTFPRRSRPAGVSISVCVCRQNPSNCRLGDLTRQLESVPHEAGCSSQCWWMGESTRPVVTYITNDCVKRPEVTAFYSFYSCRPVNTSTYKSISQATLQLPRLLKVYFVCQTRNVPVHRRSPILVLTGSDVAQLRWSRPTRYH